MYENDLVKNLMLISKFMIPQAGQQLTVIHILSNISTSKGNQIIKFGHLTKCNMRNIFLEKSSRKYAGKTIPIPFSEKLKLSISLD